MALIEKLRAQALRLGFVLFGVTSADPPDHQDNYRDWLEKGHHAGMGYLAKEEAIQRRFDPKLILPSCRSIIVTATNYAPESPADSSGSAEAQVAAYAQGQDYHDVLLKRLQVLVDTMILDLGASFKYKIYTDTGPIMERELAQRAGLGWIAKNTCLIHPEQGSYLLLGEILVDLELKSDQPFSSDHCGSCTRCIEACPTGCILPNRTLDAGRCLSYLTIEEKGDIPEDLRPAIGDWLFGCDICQQVCPWNIRFSSPTEDPAFSPRGILEPLKIEPFLHLLPGTWRTELRGSPLERPRRRGLVRNASVVAGNTKRSDLVAPLARLLLHDDDPSVRIHAAWALGQIGGQIALQALESCAGEQQPRPLQEALSAALREARLSSRTDH